MENSFDVIIEVFRAVIMVAIFLYLYTIREREILHRFPGWRAILLGFFFLAFASLLDITDNVPSLNRFVVIGDTLVQALLEKVVGYLLGSLLLLWGFVRLLPALLDLEKARKNLQESKARYRDLYDSMPSVLIGVDKDGRVTHWNTQAQKVIGADHDAAIGRTLPDVFPAFPVDLSIVKEAIDAKTPFMSSRMAVTYHDERRIVDLNVYPLMSSSASEAVVRLDDVTELAKREEELNQVRKMDAIGQLAGGVAHDFNNMLGGIMGAADLLQSRKAVSSEDEPLLDLIIQASNRAADLTAKLLAFGRKGEFVSAPVDMHKIVHETVALLRRSIDKKIDIKLDLRADDWIVVGDGSQLHSALMNVCINAHQAMSTYGAISIKTRNVTLDKIHCAASSFDMLPGRFIEISVEDSGCGIPQDDFHRIFEPFYSTKERGMGTGLGLSAVFGTVTKNCGEISVCSEQGTGTVFSILLPCSDEKDTVTFRSDMVTPGQGTILLIDDEEVIRVTAKAMLEDLGYTVLLAENGREGVDLYERERNMIDLVVLDMVMPVMNGRETFVKLKEINQGIKVVLSSGFSEPDDFAELMCSGVLGYIRKPYHKIELSHGVADALGIVSQSSINDS